MKTSFFDGKRLISLDKRYKYHYTKLREYINVNTATIFLLCVLIGYKSGEKLDVIQSGGAEFRPSYYDIYQRSLIYAIAYNEYGDDLYKKIGDRDFQNEFRDMLIMYSNSGMETLINEVFQENMIDGKFLSSYTEYDTDLLKYVYQSIIDVPF